MAANDCVNCVGGNCLRAGSPEYQKCYKEEHNSACLCSCLDAEVENNVNDDKTIVRQKFVRSDFV